MKQDKIIVVYELLSLHLFSLPVIRIFLRLEMLSRETEDMQKDFFLLFQYQEREEKQGFPTLVNEIYFYFFLSLLHLLLSFLKIWCKKF